MLEPDEYIDALRIRLGFPFAAENSECPSCGGVLDRRGIHAQSCAQVETTRGHHRVCHRVHMVASLADPESVPEPVNHIPSRPLLRPADILTSALFRRLCGPSPTCSLTGVVVVWRCHAGVAAKDGKQLVVQNLFSFSGGPRTNEIRPFSGSRSEVTRIRPSWSEFVQSEFVNVEYTREVTLNIREG